LFCFGFSITILIFPFFMMHLIWTNRKIIKTKYFKRRFGMLTEELRRRTLLQLYYYPIFLFQRLFIAGVIVFGYSYPFFQVIAVIGSNIFMITYLIKVRPFKEENQRVTTVIDEIMIMICVCLFIIFLCNETMSEKARKEVGWGIIGLILFSVLKNFGVVIYFGYRSVRQKLRQIFSAEDEMEDSPSDSDRIVIELDLLQNGLFLDYLNGTYYYWFYSRKQCRSLGGGQQVHEN